MNVEAMSVRDLKAVIAEAGMNSTGVLEKSELQALARQALAKPQHPLKKTLGRELLMAAQGRPVGITAALEGAKYVLVYLSAHWCPPCRQFTPQLMNFYQKHHKAKSFEIVFLSADRSEEEFDEYYEAMPWLAVPFSSPNRRSASATYGSGGIPELVVMDARGTIIRRGAVQNVYADPKAQYFPWH